MSGSEAAQEDSEWGNLRNEAQSQVWEQLNRDQRKAFQQIIGILRQTMLHLAETSEAERNRKYRSSLESGGHQGRLNQTILVSGDRGTGKTSLMLSIVRSLDQDVVGRDWDEEVQRYLKSGNDEHQREARALYDGVEDNLRDLRERIVWLEPLDMERHFEPSNLLVAICVRLLQICDELTGQPRDCLQPAGGSVSRGVGELAQTLRRLCRDAALSWDGNLEHRRNGFSAEQYAQEVSNTEESRMRLTLQLSQAVSQLSDYVSHQRRTCPKKGVLFILPIDDFDMNSARSLDVVRLLRMLHHGPGVLRILTLVLGNRRRLEEVLQLKMTGDDAAVAGLKLDQNVLHHDLFADQRLTTQETLRKLIPPAQQFTLSRLDYVETLGFRPDRARETLGEMLSRIGLHISTSKYPLGSSAQKIHTFKDFLLGNPYRDVASPEKTERGSENDADGAGGRDDGVVRAPRTRWQQFRRWTALELYDDTVRRMLDVWIRVRSLTREIAGNAGQLPDAAGTWNRQLLVDLFKEAVDSDEYLVRWDIDNLRPVKSVFELQRVLKSRRSTAGEDAEAERPTLTATFAPLTEWMITAGAVSVELELRDAGFNAISADLSGSASPRQALDFARRSPVAWKAKARQGGSAEKGLLYRRPGESVSGSQRADERLADRTLSLLMMAHDTIVLSPYYNGVTNLVPKSEEIVLVRSEWGVGVTGLSERVRIPWLSPPFRSFWECDHFVAEWEQVAELVRTGMEASPADQISGRTDQLHETIALSWIATGNALFDPDRQWRPEPDDAATLIHWRDAVERRHSQLSQILGVWMNDLAKSVLQTKRGGGPQCLQPLLSECIQEWLRHVVLLLAPETGMPTDVARDILEHCPDIVPLISGGENAKRMRRFRARSAAAFRQSGGEDQLGRLFGVKPSVAGAADISEKERLEELTAVWFEQSFELITVLLDGLTPDVVFSLRLRPKEKRSGAFDRIVSRIDADRKQRARMSRRRGQTERQERVGSPDSDAVESPDGDVANVTDEWSAKRDAPALLETLQIIQRRVSWDPDWQVVIEDRFDVGFLDRVIRDGKAVQPATTSRSKKRSAPMKALIDWKGNHPVNVLGEGNRKGCLCPTEADVQEFLSKLIDKEQS